MKEIIEKLINHHDLTSQEMEQAFEAIMAGEVSETMISAFLVALRAKGETPAEIAAAAKIMRKNARPVRVNGDTVDTCGTGGDYASTFNISTAVAFVLAGAGLKVAKHGNRSSSSSSGSADCLEALNIPIDLGPAEVASSIAERGFGFMFAPNYHPSMKHVMPVRKNLGLKTIFNILGPLSNPAAADYQVLGVFSPDLIDPMVQVLQLVGVRGAMVVHGGLDEVNVAEPTSYARLVDGHIRRGTIDPAALGMQAENLAELKVASPAESAAIVEAVLRGERQGACRNIVLLNAAAALMAVDADLDIAEGVARAVAVIDSGAAYAALERVRA